GAGGSDGARCRIPSLGLARRVSTLGCSAVIARPEGSGVERDEPGSSIYSRLTSPALMGIRAAYGEGQVIRLSDGVVGLSRCLRRALGARPLARYLEAGRGSGSAFRNCEMRPRRSKRTHSRGLLALSARSGGSL